MSKLTPSSRSNPCFCGDIKGRCRTNGDIWMCMPLADTRKSEVVGGYKCISHSKNRLWAVFKPDDSYEWTEERKREWETLRIQRQRKAEDDEQQQRIRALSASDRHKWNSLILASLPVDADLIKDLEGRGFSQEEIAACEFKSVEKWQKLDFEVARQLPGIGKDGKSLVVGGDGYLCPVYDFDRHILAFQVRLHQPQDNNRYRWLSTPESATLKLYPEGENPLAVFRPVGRAEGISLVEGTGAKPFLTSRRLNQLVIGASGGQFPSSRKLLEQYLERAYQEVRGERIVTIYPDAGDVGNKDVMQRWDNTYTILKELGWKVRFGWWGQLTKLHDDIDELTDYSKIQYILSGDFFAIAKQQINDAEKCKQQEEERQQQKEDLKRLIAERNKLTHITELPYKVVNVPHMGEVLEDLIEPGTINIIISDTGTGKSESIIPLAKEAEAIYSWHNRISLGKMLSIVLGINYKDDISRHNKKKATFCAPSAYQFDPKHLSNKGILLIDECDQVFDFLFGSLCNKDGIRPLLLSTLEGHFKAVIAGKGIALCMSADITQKEIDYIKAVAPEGTPVRLIINKYQPKRPNIYHDPSSTPDGLVDKLIQNLGDRIPCFALDDMKNGVRGCKSLAEYVRTTLPEIADLVLEIHADNSNDPRVQAFFKNPDEESKKYLLIICSPSVVSGVSLKNKRFINGVFGFCNGILIDREIKQFLNRVRGAEEIHLWIAEDGFPVRGIDNELTTPEEIKAYYQRNYDVNSKHILSLKPEYEPIKGEWSSPHFELFCKNLAYRIITMKNLRQFTLDHLREIGYGIIEEENIPEGGTKAIEDKLKLIWSDIEISEAEAISSARFLSEAEMEALEFSTEAIPPDVLPSYKKTKMRDYFGEELIEATKFKHKKTGRTFTGYAAMALKNARGDYGRALEAFYLLSQDLSESVGRDVAAEHRQQKRGHGRFVGDVRWNTRKWRCREWLGLKEFLKPGEWWEPAHYQPMVEKAKAHARHVKDALGLSIENITAGQIFGELMRQVGLSFETKSVEGQKWKLRKIKDEDWQYTQMFVRHKEALKAKEPQAQVETTVQTAVQTVGFTPETLAEVLTIIDTREQYEDILTSNDKAVVDAALALVTQEVRDRILAFYHEPEPLQMSLDDIKMTDSNVVTKENHVREFLSDTVDDSAEELVKVDEEIKKSAPLCNLHEIPSTDLWTRRLNRAVLMSHQIARAIYQMMPQQILDVVWLTLSGGVQNAYCQLFAPG